MSGKTVNKMVSAQNLHGLIESAIRDGIFPGCSLVVSEGPGKRRIERSWGRLTYALWSPEVTPGTIFDLASLTKPLAVAMPLAVLVAQGVIGLDTRVSHVIPESRAVSAGRLTLGRLLCHTGGLAPLRPLHERLETLPPEARREALLAMLLEEEADPSCRVAAYSDLGYLLLGFVIEEVTGLRLDAAARNLVFSPFGAPDLSFGPLNGLSSEGVAPSGFCPRRKRVLWGEVHDPNAWAAGGIAGHAGLFGSAQAVASALESLLAIFQGSMEINGLSRWVLREFFRRQGLDLASTWALGFDTPSLGRSSAGRMFSPESVGHLGYTGTSFWMDLAAGIIVVFLSNRTFPHDTEGSRLAMKAFRPLLHDLVREECV